MKYSEAKGQLNTLGIYVEDEGHTVDLIQFEDSTVGSVSTLVVGMSDNMYVGFLDLPDEIRTEVTRVMQELANTPIKERGATYPAEYYLKLGDAIITNPSYQYLNYNREEQTYFLGSCQEIANFQTTFTDEEVEAIKATYEEANQLFPFTTKNVNVSLGVNVRELLKQELKG